MRTDREDLSNWPAVFSDNDASRFKVFQNTQALGLELRRGDSLFFEHESYSKF